MPFILIVAPRYDRLWAHARFMALAMMPRAYERQRRPAYSDARATGVCLLGNPDNHPRALHEERRFSASSNLNIESARLRFLWLYVMPTAGDDAGTPELSMWRYLRMAGAIFLSSGVTLAFQP